MQGLCYLNGGPVEPPNRIGPERSTRHPHSDRAMVLILLLLFGLVLFTGFAVVDSLDLLEKVRNACHSSTTSV